MITQHRPKRKHTGSRYKSYRGKRLFEKGNSPTLPNIAERKAKTISTIGGNIKVRLMADNIMNLTDPKTKKTSKVKIKIVVENPANRHYARRNALTKGAIVETEAGKARITSRPAQDGIVNGILIS